MTVYGCIGYTIVWVTCHNTVRFGGVGNIFHINPLHAVIPSVARNLKIPRYARNDTAYVTCPKFIKWTALWPAIKSGCALNPPR